MFTIYAPNGVAVAYCQGSNRKKARRRFAFSYGARWRSLRLLGYQCKPARSKSHQTGQRV